MIPLKCHCLLLVLIVFVANSRMELAASDLRVKAKRLKRSDDTLPLETIVEQLSQRVSSQEAQLASLTAKTASLGKTVAFYAWNTLQPLQALSLGTLILDHVNTNIGNGYDPHTGAFTAPVSGTYSFQANFMTHQPGGEGSYIEASLYLDNQELARGISDSRHGRFDQCSIHTVTHVIAGQRVYVRNVESKPIEFYVSLGEPYTTFSGFLIQPDQ